MRVEGEEPLIPKADALKEDSTLDKTGKATEGEEESKSGRGHSRFASKDQIEIYFDPSQTLLL